MRFKPMSENEIAEAGLWPAGEVDFEVADAEDTVSKANNDMTRLTVHVFNDEGQRLTVEDYLVAVPKAMFKVRHFAEATGLLDQYERGELLAVDMVGRTGRCKLVIQKDKSGQYPDKNGIADYLKPKSVGGGMGTPLRQKPSNYLDDEIPFNMCWQ